MENTAIPPFYVGQEVIANRDHSGKEFKKGEEFKITSIYKGCCIWVVTIGKIAPTLGISSCNFCSYEEYIRQGQELPYYAFLFSPKIEIKEFISMKQLAEQQLELIGVN